MQIDARLIAILLLLTAPAAQAQLWKGPAGLEIQVEDPKGQPLSGARVQVQYTAIDPKDGPPPVATDSRGQASVGALAEGTWLLEVSQEGFMTYVAQINVQAGDRPTVIMATQVKVPGAQRTMRVELARGRSTPAPAATPSRRSPPPPPAPPAVTRPVVQPAPEPTRAEPVQFRAPESKPAPPAPAPTPAVQPAALPAPPADPVRLRTAKDRTCFECPPGESALSTERVVPPGGGTGCGADIAAQLQAGEPPPSLPAGCQVLRIALAAGARFTGYRFEVQDEGESLDCLAGKDCPRETGRWPINPVLVRSAEKTVVLAPFETGPAERERRAVLTVYFSTGTSRRPR